GFLPLYGLDYIGIRRYLQIANKHFVFIEASAAKRNIIYHRNDGQETHSIPHPHLLMVVKLEEGSEGTFRVRGTRLFAMQTALFSEDTQLFSYPYGNVFVRDHGRVCWGEFDREVGNARYKNILQSGGLM